MVSYWSIILNKVLVPYTVYTEATAVESDSQAEWQKFLDKHTLSESDAQKIEKWMTEMSNETECME